MEWIVSLELRAVNTCPAELGDGRELWTWGNANGVRIQIDYICCSEGVLGVASVVCLQIGRRSLIIDRWWGGFMRKAHWQSSGRSPHL